VLILGIDTATPQVGCAIGGHEGVIASFSVAKGKRHTETLVPAMIALVHKMIEHFGNPATPYAALPWPEFIPHFNDYEHLERVAEWSTVGEDE